MHLRFLDVERPDSSQVCNVPDTTGTDEWAARNERHRGRIRIRRRSIALADWGKLGRG
jgi:hypothetical protein